MVNLGIESIRYDIAGTRKKFLLENRSISTHALYDCAPLTVVFKFLLTSANPALEIFGLG